MTKIEIKNKSINNLQNDLSEKSNKSQSKSGCLRIFIILLLLNLVPGAIYFYINRPTMESGLDSSNSEIRLESALHFSTKNTPLSRSIMVLLCSDTDARIRHIAINATAKNAGPAIFKTLCKVFDESPQFSGDHYCIRRYLEIMAGLGTQEAARRILDFPGSRDSILCNRHINALSSVINMIRPDVLAKIDSMTPAMFHVFCEVLIKNRDYLTAPHIHQYIAHEARYKIVVNALLAIGPKALGGIGAVYNRSVTPIKLRILNLLGKCGYGDIDSIFRRALSSSRPKLVKVAMKNILLLGRKKAVQELVPDVLKAYHKNKKEYQELVIDILSKAEMKEVALHIFKIVLEDGLEISKVYVPLLKSCEWNIFKRLLKPGRADNIDAACAIIDFYGDCQWPVEVEMMFNDYCASESRPERRITILEHIGKHINQSSLMSVQQWARISNIKIARMISKLNADFEKEIIKPDAVAGEITDKTFGSAIFSNDNKVDFSYFDMNRYQYTSFCDYDRLIDDHLYDNKFQVRQTAISRFFARIPNECIFALFENGHKIKDNDVNRLIADNYKYIKPFLMHNTKTDPEEQALFRVLILNFIIKGNKSEDKSWIVDALIQYENHFSEQVRKDVIKSYKTMKDNAMAAKRLDLISQNIKWEFRDILELSKSFF